MSSSILPAVVSRSPSILTSQLEVNPDGAEAGRQAFGKIPFLVHDDLTLTHIEVLPCKIQLRTRLPIPSRDWNRFNDMRSLLLIVWPSTLSIYILSLFSSCSHANRPLETPQELEDPNRLSIMPHIEEHTEFPFAMPGPVVMPLPPVETLISPQK